VVAVWTALTLAPSDRAPRAPADRTSIQLPSTIDGFRADAAFLPDDDLLGFVEIPGGPFTMGSDPGIDSLGFDIEWWGNGRVQGTPDVPTFYLAKFETTVAQYAAFVLDAPPAIVDARALEGPLDRPVRFVSWADAVNYTTWLDAHLRAPLDPDMAGEPTAAGARSSVPVRLRELLLEGWRIALPTEAQWEKAARGTDARIYPWGNEPRADRAVFRAASPARVGSMPCPECPYGLSDMSGNVWEWTRSPFQPYPYTDDDDRQGLTTEALWVMRGGSYPDQENFVRAANRGAADPGARRTFLGFRVALVRE
jgi:formylglycine-generating enzyme required for sulfatase activity